MNVATATPLIDTIEERCRLCYTCVRECPAKAIRIKNGQATVIEARCIACGNCLRVCSQGAKQFRRTPVLLSGSSSRKTALCLAPSFAAEFTDIPPPRLFGMIRAAGFTQVHEVGFGADLVARRYRKLVAGDERSRYIATLCPAMVNYVERYHPGLVPALAPIVSPMVAMARYLKRVHGPELEIVFAGPCIAKKREAEGEVARGDISAVLTFIELRELFASRGITPENSEDRELDPPFAAKGTLVPLIRGLIEAAQLEHGLACDSAMSADGRSGAFDAIVEFQQGAVGASLLEVLACAGCYMGPGMSNEPLCFTRQAAVARYARNRLAGLDLRAWQASVEACDDLDLSCTFTARDERLATPSEEELALILAKMGRAQKTEQLNCGACGYATCRDHAIAIQAGLAESEMCLPYTIDKLKRTVSELANTQEALMHAEKLASMGQLAAGIAHEVNNPLGVVLMYAHLLLDDCAEGSPMHGDLTMIAEQANRCKRIVAELLNFARQNRAMPTRVDLRALVAQSVRAMKPPSGVTVRTEHDGDQEAELDRDQMAQVLTNLIDNAYDAMPHGGLLTVRTGGDADHVWFLVSDTGAGIEPHLRKKVFEPFFTTKPMGEGTGLGLSVTYGIIKIHRGEITLESNSDARSGPTGTTFTVNLPRITQQD